MPVSWLQQAWNSFFCARILILFIVYIERQLFFFSQVLYRRFNLQQILVVMICGRWHMHWHCLTTIWFFILPNVYLWFSSGLLNLKLKIDIMIQMYELVFTLDKYCILLISEISIHVLPRGAIYMYIGTAKPIKN